MGKMKEKYIEYMEKIAGSEDDGYGQFIADENTTVLTLVLKTLRSHQIHCSQTNSNPHFLFHFLEVHMVGTIPVKF